MATKEKTYTSILTLKDQTAKKLVKILSEPQTKAQKTSVTKSVGVYGFYKTKWQKKTK